MYPLPPLGIPPIPPIPPLSVIPVTGFAGLLVGTIGIGLIFAGFLALRMAKIHAAKRGV